MENENGLKVFVVDGVLCDYTCGCIIVAAKSREEAIEIIREKGDADYLVLDEPDWADLLEEVTEGYYNAVWGGG